MENIPNPHDRLFKETWSHKENARDFLQYYLPHHLLASIDLESLEICKETFIEADLQEYFSDLLYKATLSGKPGYLYFLFEHKSHPEKRIALQLLSYQQAIWSLHLKQEPLPLPVVVPMVLYHGREKWTAGYDLLHLFGETDERFQAHIPNFKYILYDLSQYPDADIKGEVFFRAVMLLLKYVFQPEYRERIPGILEMLHALLEKDTALQYIETVLRYILATVEDMDAAELKHMVAQALSPEKGELVMTLGERLFNEGMKKGLQKGKEEGILQGMQEGMQEGIQKGIQLGIVEGLLEGIELGIGVKFGARGMKLMPAIRKIQDPERLRAIKEAVKIAESTAEIEELI